MNSNRTAFPSTPPAQRGGIGSLLWRILGRVALACATFAGVAGLWSAAEKMRMATLPLTPLEPLTRTVDLSLSMEDPPPPPVRDGARVRVEGFLRGDPPLQARNRGRSQFAMQKLLVTHIARHVVASRASSTRATDAREQKTPRLWLYVDESESATGRIEVRLPRLWDGEQLLLPSIVGTVSDAETIPNNLFEALAVDAPEPASGQQWELWTVPQNARVTIVARARLDTGRVLLDLERGSGSALSPRPWSEVTSAARGQALGQLVIGLLCLSPLGFKMWKRARVRRQPAST